MALHSAISAAQKGSQIIPDIVRQHVENTADLHATRTTLTRSPRVTLQQIGRFDERIAAHLDALTLAGEAGWSLCHTALDRALPGTLFTAAAHVIRCKQEHRVERLVALTATVPKMRPGLVSAFGWVERDDLQGTVARLLGSQDTLRRLIGIAACAVHRVDPGNALREWVGNECPRVRARALRMAGELGRRECASTCVAGLDDEDPDCGFWAAWSAVLLGDRNRALRILRDAGTVPHPHRARALGLTLQVMSATAAHAFLRQLPRGRVAMRWLIDGSGIVGDPFYVPWLISHMADDQSARVAGEAFSLITGADLGLLNLERKPPENFQSGPNDDPEDPNVHMDSDDGLPWPDPERVQRWWDANKSRFQEGQRYFIGAPVTREHCIDVLKNGYQRQRILAAHYLSLLNPGTPLFNTSSPAWRQQRLLAEMK